MYIGLVGEVAQAPELFETPLEHQKSSSFRPYASYLWTGGGKTLTSGVEASAGLAVLELAGHDGGDIGEEGGDDGELHVGRLRI